MVTVSFQGDFTVELTGTCSLADKMKEYYQGLAVDEDTSVDLECRIGEVELEPEKVLGKPTQYYGRNDDWFLRADKQRKLRIKKDWSRIEFSPQVPNNWVFKLIEYRARLRLTQRGETLVHASGARVDGTTLAFPAWRHTGKTNSLMTLLREHDADYLSDDRLWLGGDGSVHGFPLPVNLQPYNYNAFPNVSPPTRFHDRRYRTANFIRDKTSDTGSFFNQAVYFFNEFYIAPPSKKVRIEELFPDVGYVDEESLDALVCLQTVGKGGVELEEVTAEEASTYLRSISQREWNGFLRDFVSAFDLLFQEVSADEEFDGMIQREWEIWTDIFEETDTYVMTIPREEQWDDKDLSDEVLDELSPVL